MTNSFPARKNAFPHAPLRAALPSLALASLGLASLALAAGRAAAETTVYAQPAAFPGASFDAWTSTSDPVTYGSIFTTYDNFTLAASAPVDALTWQGFTFNAGSDGPDASEPESFTVDFYANGTGEPGALLSSQTVSYQETSAGTVDFFSNGLDETIYDYTASLPAAFDASAGTEYWVSIVGNVDYPGFWTWTQGTGGDDASYQEENPTYGPNTGVRVGDRAFSLLSAAPEPPQAAMLALIGLGIGGLALCARRKTAA